jgi:riboflavin synthase alpha subunit
VGSTDPSFEDAALHAGDSITVDGVTVTVTATSADGDTVKVSVP